MIGIGNCREGFIDVLIPVNLGRSGIDIGKMWAGEPGEDSASTSTCEE